MVAIPGPFVQRDRRFLRRGSHRRIRFHFRIGAIESPKKDGARSEIVGTNKAKGGTNGNYTPHLWSCGEIDVSIWKFGNRKTGKEEIHARALCSVRRIFGPVSRSAVVCARSAYLLTVTDWRLASGPLRSIGLNSGRVFHPTSGERRPSSPSPEPVHHSPRLRANRGDLRPSSAPHRRQHKTSRADASFCPGH